MKRRLEAREWYRIVDSYLERCFAEQTPPRAGELAMERGMSACQLSRQFSAATGVGILSYMRAEKLQFAVSLLVQSDDRLEQIAKRAGFGSRSAFFREFNETLSVSPGRFRERHHS